MSAHNFINKRAGIIKVKELLLYMITSSRKIVAGLLSSAMVLTTIAGLSVSIASADYTRSLTVGSRGADVTELQTTLAAAGFLTVSPTGYFGSLTKRALAQWQASVGISPASGYFGPITRAYIASNGAAGGTASGNNGGSTTPGCPAGAMYNYMTGAKCAGSSTPSTSTTEGSLTVAASASPSNNSNITANSDVQVYGLELKAKLADVTVSRLDLDVGVTVGSTIENPGNLINTIKVWDGSTLVKSWAVGTADFNTGTTSNDYYVRLSGLNFVVARDTTKNLVVSFSTNGGIDTDRTVVIKGYGTNSLLAVSGNNINSYYDASGIIRTHTFKKPGTANLTVAADVTNPLSQTNRLASTTNGALNTTLLNFSAKADTGDAKITSVSVIATSSNTTGPTALYLYDGSTVVSQATISSWVANTAQTVTFNNITNLTVANGTTKTLRVSGDFNTSTLNGTIASTSVSSVTYQKPNGSSAVLAVNVQGNSQYFYQVSPQWTLVGTPTLTVNGANSTTGSTTGLTATFVLSATPVGGTMVTPAPADFTGAVASSTGGPVSLGTADAVVVTGNPTVLAEGSAYTVTVSFTVNPSDLTGASAGTTLETVSLTNASASVAGQSIAQTWGLNNFKTSAAPFYK